MAYELKASSILSSSLKHRAHKLVGICTAQGHVFCTECANKLRVQAQETYYSDDSSDWTITCERCEDTILELID